MKLLITKTMPKITLINDQSSKLIVFSYNIIFVGFYSYLLLELLSIEQEIGRRNKENAKKKKSLFIPQVGSFGVHNF